jgi:hypothetical protein
MLHAGRIVAAAIVELDGNVGNEDGGGEDDDHDNSQFGR